MLEEDRGRRRGPGLLAGAIAVAAAASLGTLALVESTAGPQIAGSLAASFVNPAPDGGGGKGGATPTPDGKGKGQPTPTPTGKGKGFGSQPTITTLATAQQAAGFRVRTLDGLPGAQLVRVTVQTVTFDTAPGQPTVPSVTLVYSLGQTQVSITEVRDPLPMPAAQTYADVLTAGGSTYLVVPKTGPVNAASAKAPDGVSIVVNFFVHTPAGVTGTDRQTAQQVLQQIG